MHLTVQRNGQDKDYSEPNIANQARRTAWISAVSLLNEQLILQFRQNALALKNAEYQSADADYIATVANVINYFEITKR